jgi:SAM-dependent methyltransferase
VISEKYKKITTKKGTSHWLKRTSNPYSFINALKEHFGDVKDLKVLDAGCAQGRDAEEIRGAGAEVIGIDHNPEFIKEAKKAYPRIQFDVGPIEHLPYKNGEFDAVYCVNTLFYTKPEESLPELERVVRVGGIIFITLDKKIFDINKNIEIHSLDIDKALKNFKKSEFMSKTYLERVDETPFKHQHFFYEIVLIKKR